MKMSVAIDQRAILGESLLWNAATATWWWTDIDAHFIYCRTSGGEAVQSFAMPDKVGSFVFCTSGKMLLGLAKQLAWFDTQTGAVTPFLDVETELASTRINDGRTDRAGNYVFGTIDQQLPRQPIASFYQYSSAHGLRRLDLPKVAIANSLCFSLDGRTLYFTDTPSRRIMQCDYDAQTAQVSEPRLFVETEAHAFPDGSVVDSAGCVWNAQWGAAQIVQYAPDGCVLQRIAVPVKNPTCPAFGGAELDYLMVTSSRKDMSADELAQMPQAGSLFELSMTSTRGVADARFKDN
ncbi:MAG: SMP-30/gluconolactonase/LRE family protein [Burkholderiales bacterium]|nr:SMP-30/gluconolactonase/LRE family protein [Burkholderiales bacterium]